MSGSPKKRERRERTQKFLADEEQVEDLLAYIAAGGRLREFCMQKDLTYSTVQERITSSDAVMPRYQSAMDARSDLERERIEEIIELVENGQMDPKAGAVAIGGRQWLAKTMNRRRYGDQQVVDVAVTDKTRLHIEALRLIARRPRRQITAEVIEGVFSQLPAQVAAEALPVALVSRE